jgi:hypothetical protein
MKTTFVHKGCFRVESTLVGQALEQREATRNDLINLDEFELWPEHSHVRQRAAEIAPPSSAPRENQTTINATRPLFGLLRRQLGVRVARCLRALEPTTLAPKSMA